MLYRLFEAQKVGLKIGLKGQTLPLRFGQFKYACWTTSLSTLTLMGVAKLIGRTGIGG